jgi:AraC-like DNA-binding protein
MQVEYNFNFFSILILLGVIQGLYLSYFFIFQKSKKKVPNIFMGMLLFSLSLVILEIFLNYTGLIVNVISINNFSEAFGFLIAPLLFLYIITSVGKEYRPALLLHFLPFFFWIAYSIPDYIQSDAFKYNCYLDVYHPEAQRLDVIVTQDTDPMGLRTYVNEILIFQLILYLAASYIQINESFKKKEKTFFSRGIKPESWLRDFTLLITMMVIVLILVKLFYIKDLGDYLIASFISIAIYATYFYMLFHSSFFRESVSMVLYEGRKYAKSSLDKEQKDNIIKDLEKLMEEEKYFTDNLVSLPQVSRMLKVSVHHLSQSINEHFNLGFFEFIARYRVEEAKIILQDPSRQNLTIEEVAEEVGYNSKSAFNRAFKKITGKTPSQFRDH